MQVLGFNRWDFDAPTDFLIRNALKFAEGVKAEGIAQLREASIAPDKNLMWCSWDTDNLDSLQAAFDEMNKDTGLVSELTPVEAFYPE